MPEAKPTTGREDSFERLLDVPLRVSVELGRSQMRVQQLLDLGQGSVIDLERLAGEPVDVYVNGRPFGTAEVVLSRDRYAVRILSIRSPTERLESLT